MVRQTLLVVATTRDEHLLHLAGSMVRYAWQGVRTVLVVVDDGVVNDSLLTMTRAATLLGVEQRFHWQAQPTISNRLARTFRAFQPQILLTTDSMVMLTLQAWHQASDGSVSMPGLALLNGDKSSIWVPGGTSAMIEVPFTAGIRHALACLWAEGRYSIPEMRRRIAHQEWSAFEGFAWAGGAPVIHQTPISDFFGIKTM